jgi:hypothetical protein
MKQARYRLATMTFAEDACPTWRTRSVQILEQMTRWGREGWRLSPLNASAHIRLHARGFRVLLERPFHSPAPKAVARNSDPHKRNWAA